MIKTISLELAKKMKELGFPQETYLSWHRGMIPAQLVRSGMYTSKAAEERGKLRDYAAPTAEEVLEQLPHDFGDHRLSVYYLAGWNVAYIDEDGSEWYEGADIEIDLNERGKFLAEAAGKMWVYLKEQKLI